MPFYVYVLKNRVTGKLYKGQTQDLEKRIKEHFYSGTKTTSHHPKHWELIFYEVFDTRDKALLREKYFKSSAGRKFLRSHIK